MTIAFVAEGEPLLFEVAGLKVRTPEGNVIDAIAPERHFLAFDSAAVPAPEGKSPSMNGRVILGMGGGYAAIPASIDAIEKIAGIFGNDRFAIAPDFDYGRIAPLRNDYLRRDLPMSYQTTPVREAGGFFGAHGAFGEGFQMDVRRGTYAQKLGLDSYDGFAAPRSRAPGGESPQYRLRLAVFYALKRYALLRFFDEIGAYGKSKGVNVVAMPLNCSCFGRFPGRRARNELRMERNLRPDFARRFQVCEIDQTGFAAESFLGRTLSGLLEPHRGTDELSDREFKRRQHLVV